MYKFYITGLIFMILIHHAVFNFVEEAAVKKCIPKDFGKGSIVCVCNATYCDTVPPLPKKSNGQYTVYTSSKAGQRLSQERGSFSDSSKVKGNVIFTINRNESYQKIFGFGGAFTDAAGINILKLSPKTQQILLASYYAPMGIEYTLGRVPMASCDFSVRPYSYDDSPGDFDLKNFKLAPEDLKYKIPLIHKARKMSKNKIPLFGSPWSSPAWMKTNQNMTGKGSLIGQPGGKYYQTWALYFVKFLQAYAQHGIDFWGLTAQNEPTNGMMTDFSFQALGFTPELQRDFIALDLGPALHANGFKNVSLIMLDDQRLLMLYWAKKILNSAANKFVSGIGVHWYLDDFTPVNVLSMTHEAFPDKFILATEACRDAFIATPWYNPVNLGSWKNFEAYSHDIIQDLNHWSVGWTDWNIALNMQGGPNWVKNYVDSPIIVNPEKDEFYKQPMFYALGHFSKFIVPGSKRIGLQQSAASSLESVAFVTPNGLTVVVISNRDSKDIPFLIKDGATGISYIAKAHSLQTFVW